MAETLTLEQIVRTLEDGALYPTIGGVRYLVTWDEDCTGIYAWPEGAPDDAPSVARFGDDPDDAAEAILDWIDSAPLPTDRSQPS